VQDSANHGWNFYQPDTSQGNCRRFSHIGGAGQAMGYPWRADMGFSAMQKSAMAAMFLTALSEG
jgi:hypothetical protein